MPSRPLCPAGPSLAARHSVLVTLAEAHQRHTTLDAWCRAQQGRMDVGRSFAMTNPRSSSSQSTPCSVRPTQPFRLRSQVRGPCCPGTNRSMAVNTPPSIAQCLPLTPDWYKVAPSRLHASRLGALISVRFRFSVVGRSVPSRFRFWRCSGSGAAPRGSGSAARNRSQPRALAQGWVAWKPGTTFSFSPTSSTRRSMAAWRASTLCAHPR